MVWFSSYPRRGFFAEREVKPKGKRSTFKGKAEGPSVEATREREGKEEVGFI